MYITKTEGPALPAKRAKAAQPRSKSDSSFEETVITLLSDAVEVTNPNDERRRREDGGEELQDETAPRHKAREGNAETPGSSARKSSLSVSA